MNTYTVLLTNDTVGTFHADAEPKIGEKITVDLRDENGMPMTAKGRVADVLEAVAPWGASLYSDTVVCTINY